jgi:hypothetical protein
MVVTGTSYNMAYIPPNTNDNGTPTNEYGSSAAVVSTTETTILTYTVPGGSTFKIQGFRVSGTATGLFKLKVNGAIKGIARTSASDRVEVVDFGKGYISAATGLDVVVTAYHEETANQSMDANVFGLLI